MTQLTFIANCPDYSVSTRTPPISFTEDNFCAVLTGAKTETRRLLTLPRMTQNFTNRVKVSFEDTNGFVLYSPDESKPHQRFAVKPKYQTGDRCYLTEPTQIIRLDEFKEEKWEAVVKYSWYEDLALAKSVTLTDIDKLMTRKTGAYSKQIARFMLKSFARYWIEITDVKLERLLDITTEAAIAEGVASINSSLAIYKDYNTGLFNLDCARKSYISEIEMLHGKEIAQSNPWLWVYKFKLVTE